MPLLFPSHILAVANILLQFAFVNGANIISPTTHQWTTGYGEKNLLHVKETSNRANCKPSVHAGLIELAKDNSRQAG